MDIEIVEPQKVLGHWEKCHIKPGDRLSIRSVQSVFNTSYSTASRTMNELEKMGHIERHSSGRGWIKK